MKKIRFAHRLLLLALPALLLSPAGGAEPWGFAVFSDPHGGGSGWLAALAEIREMRANPPPTFPPAEIVAVVGDMGSAPDRYREFLKAFPRASSRPLLLPVIGNHDDDDEPDHLGFVRDAMVPAVPGSARRHPRSCDYYLDHRNARMIVIDAYTELGRKGVVSDAGREWAERAIASAPPSIEHIFLFFHEPAFPRYRHRGSSFNADPRARDAFWRMLVRHRDRVRAVFVGHEHYYSRMRVRDPAGRAANDASVFPDEEGGIWQVNDGAVGPGWVRTVVLVQVDGARVAGRALQAGRLRPGRFRVADEWEMGDAPPGPGGGSPRGGRGR